MLDVHNHIVDIHILVKCQISKRPIDKHKHFGKMLETPKKTEILSPLCVFFFLSECLKYFVMPSFFSDRQ